jgi:hypothetical protein
MKKPSKNMGARKALQLFALNKAMDMKIEGFKDICMLYHLPLGTLHLYRGQVRSA